VRFFDGECLGAVLVSPICILNTQPVANISPLFERIVVENNYTFTSGGAVAINGLNNSSTVILTPKFIECVFDSNEARQDGGAINIKGHASPTFEKCTVTNNKVGVGYAFSSFGGAVNITTNGVNIANYSHSKFFNCLFLNNTGATGGGWVNVNVPNISTADADFVNCTVVGHRSQLAGLVNLGSGANIKLSNCIFWDNDAPGYSRLISAIGNSAISMEYCLIEASSCVDPAIRIFPGATFNCLGGNIFNQNPQFVNPAAGNYRLSLTSPAINAGSNALVLPSMTTDLAGNVRIDNGTVDMGCYENFPGMMRPAVTITSTSPTYFDGFSQAVMLESQAYGGYPPYTYAWSTGETTKDISVTPSQSTTYQLVVTDSIGDTAMASFTLVYEDVRCTRKNGEPGIRICNNGGATLCVSLGTATQMVNNGAASLGACGSLKQAYGSSLEQIVVYPNPAKEYLYIQSEDVEFAHGEVFDQLGRVVMKTESNASQVFIGQLPSGVYSLQLHLASGESRVLRFVKE
jgi:predicted outer membrane repeat protein